MVELHEFAVGLNALVGGKLKGIGAVAEGFLAQKLEIGAGATGTLAVGSALFLQLQQPHIDPHLQHVPPIGGFHLAGQYLARLKGPFLQNSVDIVTSGHE